jgi:hypothetical protein
LRERRNEQVEAAKAKRGRGKAKKGEE